MSSRFVIQKSRFDFLFESNDNEDVEVVATEHETAVSNSSRYVVFDIVNEKLLFFTRYFQKVLTEMHLF